MNTLPPDTAGDDEKAGAPIVIQVYAVIIAVLFVLMSRLTTGLRG